MGQRDRRVQSAPPPGGREVIATVQTSSWVAPLPRPEIMAGYEQILPGSADRILAMAEKQAEHRQGLERSKLAGDQITQARAQWLTTGLVAIIFCGSIGLIAYGKDIAGLVAIITETVALVGVYLHGKASQRKALDAAVPQPPPAA